MSEKTRDMLLGLFAIALISVVLAVLIDHSGIVTEFDAWRERRDVRETEQEQPVPPPTQWPEVASLPPGATPATLLEGPANWITSDDYPAEALRNDWQGMVAIMWTIDARGEVSECHVVQSSGHSVLDEASCDLIRQRGHYRPARDAKGQPIPSQDRRRIIWRLPE